jgi:splicing factor 3A subunit 3
VLELTAGQIRDRLARDHDIARFLEQIETQSSRLLTIYEDVDGKKEDEVRALTHGDPMESFMNEIASIKDFHRRYPNEPVENLEKAYKRRTPEDQAHSLRAIEAMFTGEEGFGRFFDLTMLHEQYLNLPVHQQMRRLTYLQYLDLFDVFTPPQTSIRRDQKMSEAYFQYLKALQDYLEGFMRRTKPLENLDKIFSKFDDEFVELWEKEEVPGWEKSATQIGPSGGEAPGEGIWCSACKKGFTKETVYEAHLTGKKHKKAVQEGSSASSANANGDGGDMRRFKERAVAEREFRIRKLAAAMQTERSDTKVNVERKQGMTERERQQELEELYSERPGNTNGADDDDESDGEEKIYNPLKLPLAWDGKPIPFWLYKLHGLGVEFPCEICGNYVYMGRRAFDKHFNEPRHVYGLKCLGVTNTTLFREITNIEEAQTLWKKITRDQKKEKATIENVVQMEDSEGNVMPEKVYRDLMAQGLI